MEAKSYSAVESVDFAERSEERTFQGVFFYVDFVQKSQVLAVLKGDIFLFPFSIDPRKGTPSLEAHEYWGMARQNRSKF